MKTVIILNRDFNKIFYNRMDRAILLAGGEINYFIDHDLSVDVSDCKEIFPQNRINLPFEKYINYQDNKPLAYQVTLKGTAEKSRDLKYFLNYKSRYIHQVINHD